MHRLALGILIVVIAFTAIVAGILISNRRSLPVESAPRVSAADLAVKEASIRDTIAVPLATGEALIVVFEVDYTEGDPETYLLPIMLLPGPDALTLLGDAPAAGIGRIRSAGGAQDEAYLVDATAVGEFAVALVEAIGARRRLRGRRGELIARPEPPFRSAVGGGPLRPSPIRSEMRSGS